MEKTQVSGKWKKPKKDQILIGILVGVLLLIVALPQGGDQKETDGVVRAETETNSEDPVAVMEEKLQNILEQVEGVGKVEVMITVSSMGKKTVEKDRTAQEESGGASGEETSTTRTEETTVYARDSEGNEVPFVTEETTPQIQGVLVAAQGGDNLVVAENITEAAEVLFGVEVHKIKIMKLN